MTTTCTDPQEHERRTVTDSDGFVVFECQQCGARIDPASPDLDGGIAIGPLVPSDAVYEHLTQFIDHHKPARVLGIVRDTFTDCDLIVAESHFTLRGDHGMSHELVGTDITSVRNWLGY